MKRRSERTRADAARSEQAAGRARTPSCAGALGLGLGLLVGFGAVHVGYAESAHDAGSHAKPTTRAAHAAGARATESAARDAGARGASSAARDAGARGASSAARDAGARGASSAARAESGAEARDAGAVPVDLDQVLQRFAAVEALSARFQEEKIMSLLAAPLKSEGVLYYEKPRQLARHTERPRKASLLLHDDVLTFGDAQHSESIGVSSQPALQVLVDTFVSVLAGDRAALERVADVRIESEAGGFRIHVTPKEANVKRLVQAMTFRGEGALLSRMELLDASGDRTVTTFSQVVLRKRFDASERARLFRVGG